MRASSIVAGVAVATAVVVPARALARVGVRFVHAVPGAGAAQLLTGRSGSVGRAAFGQFTRYRSLGSGAVTLRLLSGGHTLASTRAVLRDGLRYTVIALSPRPGHLVLRVLPDRRGQPGQTSLRMIHAAPELGRPDIRLDGKVVGHSVPFEAVTSYLPVSPGAHRIAVTPPSGPPLASVRIDLPPSSASTAIVVGTRGQRTRIVTALDGVAAAKAPASHPSMPRRRAGSSWYVVLPGDSLWKIARHELGGSATDHATAQRARRLWAMNHQRIGTGDPNVVMSGQRIRVP